MWPFKKSVVNLKQSGFFNGLTDWHSHVLPGVDDGIKTFEDSLKVLDLYEEIGLKKLWLTPHIMEDYPNETSFLKEVYEELKSKWKGNMEICLASENMLDTLFEQRLEKNDLLPIGDEGRHLLIETSYYTPPYGMDDMMDKAISSGYFLILAHPERYRYMEKDDYKRLRDKGILFQLNYLSLFGGYGEAAQKKAEWMIANDMVEILGSDVHNYNAIINHIENSKIQKNKIDKLNDIKVLKTNLI